MTNPKIIEVEDVNTANELMATELYRQPSYDLKKSVYIFIPLRKKNGSKS